MRTATFERYVSLLAKLPDTGVDANVPVPATVDGASELELTPRHRPLTVGASFDTNHPGFEAVLSASVNGVTRLGDQVPVSYIAPRGDHDKGYYTVHYSLLLSDDGLALKLSGYHYEAKNRDFVFDGALLQRGYRDARVAALLSYPVALRADRALHLEGGGYASSTGDVFTQPPLPDRLNLRAHIRAAQINLNGSLQGRTSSTEGSVRFVQGLIRGARGRCRPSGPVVQAAAPGPPPQRSVGQWRVQPLRGRDSATRAGCRWPRRSPSAATMAPRWR